MDDNDDEEARGLLEAFRVQNEGAVAIVSEKDGQPYVRDDQTHYWNDALVDRVAAMKDRIIEHALEEGYDALFLIDSDLLIHANTVKRLFHTGKDIISNIFWTKWQKEAVELPQVWMTDEYSFIRNSRQTPLADEEASRQTQAFLKQMRKPGVYEVGGLGACTLISRAAMEKGVRFRRLPNVSFWGEDRHFCIRAAALGFGLYVDTRYPAYHIYRDSDLDGAVRYIRSKSPDPNPGITISLCMIVRNEEEALERCLLSVEGVADEIIIVDTGSTDRTKEIAGRFTGRIYDFDWVDDFAAARNYAFGKATESYIMWLDADDVVEEPCGFKWIGVVHEYLEVAGNIVQRDIAITHKKDKAYTDRNLQIYRRRLEQGEEFLPRDMYYFANELNDHGWFEEAADQYEKFLATKQGWIEDQIAACLKLADCCARLYERDRQLRSLFRTMEYDRPRADCCCRLGALFMSENRLQEAIYWYETATTLGEPPQSGALIDHASWTWLPHLQLCVCYDKLGQYKKAYEYNERALDYQPDHPSMLYNKRYLEEQLKERAGG